MGCFGMKIGGMACAEVGGAVIQSWCECEVITGSTPSALHCDVVIITKGQEVTVSLGLLTVRERADLLIVGKGYPHTA